MEKQKLSVIVPCYNEQEVLNDFYTVTTGVLKSMESVDYELLFIDDGSSDATMDIIHELDKSDERVRFVSFSRNFGKEAAMYAGLENARGDLLVIMDADLQHSPNVLPQMLEGIEEGYDMCLTRRSDRKGEGAVKSFFSAAFYKVLNAMADIEVAGNAQDFCMMKRVVAESILKMQENNRFTKGIYSWIGFKKKWIECENIERTKGESKWSFFGLLKYAFEGVFNFSTMPLAVASFFGALFCFVSFLLVIFICIKTIAFGEPVPGFPTLICAICLIGGIIMLAMGIIGQYLARTYLEVKNRPIYIARETSEK